MRNRWLTKYKSFAICGLVSSLLTLPSLTFGRGTFNGGGGGYGVRCSFDNGASYQLYALDFVQTEGMTTLNPQITAAKSAEEVIAIIHKGLDRTLPGMASSLKGFMKSMTRKFEESLEDKKERRLWIPGTNPLGFLNDAAELRDLKHCKIENGKLDLYQAVIREEAPKYEVELYGEKQIVQNGPIHYSKDNEVIKELAQTGPMQASFTYIHEWLRDYTDSASTIQKVNRYLHSLNWETVTGDELRTRLQRLHLVVGEVETRSEFEKRVAEEKWTDARWEEPINKKALADSALPLAEIYLNEMRQHVETMESKRCLPSYEDLANFEKSETFVHEIILSYVNSIKGSKEERNTVHRLNKELAALSKKEENLRYRLKACR